MFSRRFLTWLQVLMSTPFFRKSRTLSMFPALAARRKLVLLSDWRDVERKEAYVRNRETSMLIILVIFRDLLWCF